MIVEPVPVIYNADLHIAHSLWEERKQITPGVLGDLTSNHVRHLTGDVEEPDPVGDCLVSKDM